MQAYDDGLIVLVASELVEESIVGLMILETKQRFTRSCPDILLYGYSCTVSPAAYMPAQTLRCRNCYSNNLNKKVTHGRVGFYLVQDKHSFKKLILI